MLFGADRNLTVSLAGAPAAVHSQRPKVLRWPNNAAIIGYAGIAEIDGRTTDDWLHSFIGRHHSPASGEELAEDLVRELEEAIPHHIRAEHALVIHLGCFEQQDGYWLPKCWFVRNSVNLNYDAKPDFDQSEELLRPDGERFGRFVPDRVRDALEAYVTQRQEPFWFHQGYDLGTFNALDAFLKGAFRLLIEHHPDHAFPQTLEEWEQHLRMTILTYGAYFEAFKTGLEQPVGGGVDVVSLPWPVTERAPD